MFGKIIENKLVFAGNVIKTETGKIDRPTEQQLIANGWKEVVYNEKPTYDIEEEKLVETYTEGADKITVDYNTVELTDEEHNAVIQQEIYEEESKITARNYRMAIKGDSFAISKIDEVEENIAILRNKLR